MKGRGGSLNSAFAPHTWLGCEIEQQLQFDRRIREAAL
eukprot:COSAG06_NODE_63730_length_261_cov_0.962963_1_plen_37_part_01